MDETGKPSAEDEAWLDDFAEKMSRPTEAEKEFSRNDGRSGLALASMRTATLSTKRHQPRNLKNLKLILTKDSHRTPNAVAENRPRNSG